MSLIMEFPRLAALIGMIFIGLTSYVGGDRNILNFLSIFVATMFVVHLILSYAPPSRSPGLDNPPRIQKALELLGTISLLVIALNFPLVPDALKPPAWLNVSASLLVTIYLIWSVADLAKQARRRASR